MIKKELLILILVLSSLAGFSQSITPQYRSVTGGLMSYFYPGKSPAGFDTLWNAQTIRGYIASHSVVYTGSGGIGLVGNDFRLTSGTLQSTVIVEAASNAWILGDYSGLTGIFAYQPGAGVVIGGQGGGFNAGFQSNIGEVNMYQQTLTGPVKSNNFRMVGGTIVVTDNNNHRGISGDISITHSAYIGKSFIDKSYADSTAKAKADSVANSTTFIRNQTALTQSAAFRISGGGVAGAFITTNGNTTAAGRNVVIGKSLELNSRHSQDTLTMMGAVDSTKVNLAFGKIGASVGGILSSNAANKLLSWSDSFSANGTISANGAVIARDTTYASKYLKYFYMFGTSVEVGQGAIPNTYGYSHIYANRSGGFETNYAISGTSLVAFSPSDSSMVNRIYKIPTFSAGKDSILFIPYSINDGNSVSGPFNVTNYRSALVTVINAAKSKSWPSNKIVFYTIWNASPNNIIIDTCQRNTALATGTTWIAVRDSMASHGGDALLSPIDHTHPTNKGHELIAKVVYGAIGNGKINTLTVNSDITSNGYLYPRLGVYGSGPNGLILGAVAYNATIPVITTQGNSVIAGTQSVAGSASLNGGATIQSSLTLPGATSFTMGTGTMTANGTVNLGGTTNTGALNTSGIATFTNNISSSKIFNQNASVNSSLQILNTNTSTGTSASTLYQTQANDKTYSATLTGSTATSNPSFLVENVSTGVTRRWTIAGSRYFEISPSTFRIFSAGITASKLLFSNASQEITTTGIGTSSQLLFADGSFATASNDLTNSAGAFTIGTNKVTYAKMQAMTANRLLGSGSSGTAVNEITLGTNLSFTGNTLNATGGFTEVMTTLGDVDYYTGSARARLAGNTTTTPKFLSSTGNGTISAAPAFYDLFGSTNTWGGVNTFNSFISLLSQATNGADGTHAGFSYSSTSHGYVFNSPSSGSDGSGFILKPAATTSIRSLSLQDRDGTVALNEDLPVHGTFSIPTSIIGTVTTVTIGRTMSGTSYNVGMTPTNSAAATGGRLYVTNKTTTTFDVVSTVADASTEQYDYIVNP